MILLAVFLEAQRLLTLLDQNEHDVPEYLSPETELIAVESEEKIMQIYTNPR